MFGLCAHHGRQCRCRTFRFIRIAVNQFAIPMGGYVALAFAELPWICKGLALLNSTARADSEERKQSGSCN
jgi:hypothetical protein